jgi:hypothetical protein
MIEHFSKWLKLVPLLNHNNEGTTYTHNLDRVLNRFGVIVKILINRSIKLCGGF